MTLGPENISLTNLHEAIIEPKADGQIDKNKHMYAWGSGNTDLVTILQ